MTSTKAEQQAPMSDVEKMKDFNINRSIYDDANEDQSVFVAKPGLSEELVREISKQKKEPEWMLQKRLQGLKLFSETPVPTWGPDLSKLNFD
ncbi:TPA: Fe-S cluster assembly protein SufB, partial [Candidatus Woesearchaeota archaeon]|nr:Fe-S cluster assembly protein SufB [Candidatus Woesearchaeota archaeon]